MTSEAVKVLLSQISSLAKYLTSSSHLDVRLAKPALHAQILKSDAAREFNARQTGCDEATRKLQSEVTVK